MPHTEAVKHFNPSAATRYNVTDVRPTFTRDHGTWLVWDQFTVSYVRDYGGIYPLSFETYGDAAATAAKMNSEM